MGMDVDGTRTDLREQKCLNHWAGLIDRRENERQGKAREVGCAKDGRGRRESRENKSNQSESKQIETCNLGLGCAGWLAGDRPPA